MATLRSYGRVAGSKLNQPIPDVGDQLKKLIRQLLSLLPSSLIQAMTFTAPLHSQQIPMSILKTRFRRCAQVIARDGMYAGFAVH